MGRYCRLAGLQISRMPFVDGNKESGNNQGHIPSVKPYQQVPQSLISYHMVGVFFNLASEQITKHLQPHSKIISIRRVKISV